MLVFWLFFSLWLVALANPLPPPLESVDSASEVLVVVGKSGNQELASSSGSSYINDFRHHSTPELSIYLVPKKVERNVIPEDSVSHLDSSSSLPMSFITSPIPVYTSILPLLLYSTVVAIIVFFSIRLVKWRHRRNRRRIELEGVELLPTTTTSVSPRFRDSPLPPPLPERLRTASPNAAHSFHARSHSTTNFVKLAGDPERPKSPINLGLSSPGTRRSKTRRWSFGEGSKRQDYVPSPTPRRRPFSSEPEPESESYDQISRPNPHSTLFGTLVDLSSNTASVSSAVPSAKQSSQDVNRKYSTDDNPFEDRSSHAISEPIHTRPEQEEAMLIDFSPRLKPQADDTFPAAEAGLVSAILVSSRQTGGIETKGGYERDLEDSEKDAQEIDIAWSWGFESASNSSVSSGLGSRRVVIPPLNVKAPLLASSSAATRVEANEVSSSSGAVAVVDDDDEEKEDNGTLPSFNRDDTTLDSDLIDRVYDSEDDEHDVAAPAGRSIDVVSPRVHEETPSPLSVPIIIVQDQGRVSKEAWASSFTPSPGPSPITVAIAVSPLLSSRSESMLDEEQEPEVVLGSEEMVRGEEDDNVDVDLGVDAEKELVVEERHENINDFNDLYDPVMTSGDALLQSRISTLDIEQKEGDEEEEEEEEEQEEGNSIHGLGRVRVVVEPEVIPLPSEDSSVYEYEEQEEERATSPEEGVWELRVPFQQPFSPPPSHDDLPDLSLAPHGEKNELIIPSQYKAIEEFPDPDNLPLPDLLPPVSGLRLSTLPVTELEGSSKQNEEKGVATFTPPSSHSSYSPTQIPTPPASPPATPIIPRKSLTREREGLTSATSSPVVSTARPAWSLRAAGAPALGIPSSVSSPSIASKLPKGEDKQKGKDVEAEVKKDQKTEKALEDEKTGKQLVPATPITPKATSPIPVFGIPLSTSLPGSFPVDVHPLSEPVKASPETNKSSPSPSPPTTATSTSKALVANTTRIRPSRSPIDIALAMQLRPGLGLGADPAWMVRFLMAMFGWLIVLISGSGGGYAAAPFVGMRKTK